jgi:hypothetical protein
MKSAQWFNGLLTLLIIEALISFLHFVWVHDKDGIVSLGFCIVVFSILWLASFFGSTK